MPLHLHDARQDQLLMVSTLGGSKEVRTRLTDLGFKPGTTISIVSRNEQFSVIKVRSKFVMLGRKMASNVQVQ